jgi:hypothetical protein
MSSAAARLRQGVIPGAWPVCSTEYTFRRITPVTQFSLATNEYPGGKERTEYHNIVTWV